ncbi:single-stranded DNA-binding protein 3 [Anastrepha obliqua]|uniref:single-stranded DNA-binding protein 3 n=1 Tax=Anastrepha ludens TaxID=28586 RepID=UPI0023AF2D45|nr:single-stranded DNA-binding protein 3 [Anastrepha ludens]XP_054726867.1 single-stranded DNA-binding protein 3 [Anastrepha obliqua]
MYGKAKTSSVPSDAQAREKLALYVYEYLLHVGAQKAAQTFLSEIRWEKNITLGEPPGFLHTWWCVFWDLYCAAPERRDQCDHSSEAKAFHDYGFVSSGYGVNGIGPGGPHSAGGPAPSPLGQMPPGGEGPMGPGGPMGPNFFPNSTMRPSPPTHASSPQPPPSQMMPGQPPFMGGPRYPGGPRPGVRMQGMGNEFNGPPGQPMMPNSMDPTRPGGMGPMNPRMNPPRGPGGMGPMGYGGPGGMRGPAPGPGGMPPGMGMGAGGRPPQWQPNATAPMNAYSSSSPGNYGPGPGSNGPPGPGTPIMPSPQDNTQAGPGGPGDNMYSIMKPEFPMGGGPDGGGGGPGGMGPMGGGPNSMGPVLNGGGGDGTGLDGMKNSPANGGPGTPREDSGSGMGDYNLGGFGGPGENDQNESAAILKIKESMHEEAKRFEKDSEHPDYFMQ